MIKEFKNNKARKSAVIYETMWETVKKRYMRDPQKAGEIAISFMEYVLTGDISSDDYLIDELLDGYRETVKKNKDRYDAKVASTEEKYLKVANMLKSGMKQVEIARELGVQPPAVSKMAAKIRSEFPWMLESSESSGNEGSFQETLETNSESFQKVQESLAKNGNSNKSFHNIPEISEISTYNYNYNEYDNDNVDVTGKASLSAGQGCAPTPPAEDTEEKLKSRYRTSFDF